MPGSGAVRPREDDAARTVSAVWRVDGRRIVATLARQLGDFALAEDLAQEAVAAALEQWPAQGVPRNAAAWLTAVAKRRGIDQLRRRQGLDQRYAAMARELESEGEPEADITDETLRLIFIACHPLLPRQAQVALTLRVVSGLGTDEIARAFLVPTATIQQRIVRAKRTISEAGVAFELPPPEEFAQRLGAVLGVVYLVFNEAHTSSSGEQYLRPELAAEAIRLARTVAGLTPSEPEAHGLVALLELTAARFPARVDGNGLPVPLERQDRLRWNRSRISAGRAALRRADAIGRGRGPYCLQAGIAECHAMARNFEETDWEGIVSLYGALLQVAPSPVVELNRAAAVAMARGPAAGLALVDELVSGGRLTGYAPLAGLRGELLSRLGRVDEASAEIARAAALTGNDPERAFLMAKAATLRPPSGPAGAEGDDAQAGADREDDG